MSKRKHIKDAPVQTARWMDQAQHDLGVAQKNFKIRVYDIAIVMCEQSLEKAIKALYITQKRELPPRTHSIEFLATETKLRPKLDQMLLKLHDLYFLLRYPDPEGPLPYKLATRAEAEQVIKLTKSALRLVRAEIEHVEKEHSETPEPPES